MSDERNSSLVTHHSLPSLVNRVSQHVFRRFHHRFGQRRMGVDRLCDRLGGCFELERGAAFDDQLRRARTDDVEAEEFVVFLVGDDLHETARFAEDARFRVRGEGELADLHIVAALFRFLLRQADGCDFRLRVRAVRNVIVVERADVHSLHVLDRENAFGGCDVRERRSGNDVADRVDVRLGGAHELVDLHHAALIELHFRLFESAVFGDGATAGRGEHEIRLDDLLLSFERHRRLHTVVGHFTGVDFRVGVDVDSLLLEETREFLRHLFVFDRKKLRHYFDDRRLRAEARVDRRELASDGTGADDEQRLRHFLQQKDVIGVDDALSVRLDVRQVFGNGAHRQDDVLRGDLLAVDVDRVLVDEFSEAGDALDFVLLEEELDAFRVFVDDLLLAGLSRFEIEANIADSDAELFRFLDLVVDVGVLEQRFRQNAAAMRARPTDEWIFLDDRHLHSELPGANAGDVSARPAADDDDVVRVISHWVSSVNAGRILYASPVEDRRLACRAGQQARAPILHGSYCAGTNVGSCVVASITLSYAVTH